MVSPATSIKDIIVTEGLAVASNPSTSQWLVKVSRLTEDQDRMLSCFDTPGQNPNPKWLLDFPTAQVMIRGDIDGYDAAWTKGKQVQDVLLGRDPEVVNGDSFYSITGLGDLVFLRYDEKNRPLFSVNFRIILEPALSAESNREAL